LPHYLLGVAGLGLGYAAAGFGGLAFPYVERNVTLIWPPTGIAVAVLFRAGLRYWPGVSLGALAVNLTLSSPAAAAGIAAGNTLAPVLAVVLLRRFRFDPSFPAQRDLFGFIGLGGLLAMTVSAANGALWLWADGTVPAAAVPATALVWWLGDAAGVFLVGPGLLAVRPPLRVAPLRPAVLSLVALSAVCAVAFTPVAPIGPLRGALAYFPLLVLVWVGLRFRVGVASAHVLLFAGFAVAGTAHGVGGFALSDPTAKLLAVWAAFTTAALTTLLLVTLTGQRERAVRAAAAAERRAVEGQRLEALGVLAGGVAHDFNNILAGIQGHAELAAGPLPDGHPARPHLATVAAATARAAGLTRQLLAYAGKGRLAPRPVAVNEVVRQTAELLRVTVPRTVEVRLDLADGLPAVTADESQLHQVVMNLVLNAGEAIGDAPGTVTVATAAREVTADELHAAPPGGPAAAGRHVVLTVSDTGCGMTDEVKARLFDPFYTTKSAGRGLGLSAVLGIVRGHGGAIRVDTRPRAGTRFTVLLPASPGAAPLPPPEAPTPFPETAPLPAPGSRGLAVVADDEPSVRAVGAAMLGQLGYRVLEAADGREAVELVAAHAGAVRLVLLDLTMPVMGGPEALARIRRTDPAVPVVLCSGYVEGALPNGLADAPATAFLRKPYRRSELGRAAAAAGA
jgi:signal transduction histidine kinase/CheY-like chemotaxis protein